MSNTITIKQLNEIEEAYSCKDRKTAYALLKEYTGIEARHCTAWAFYDTADNYVGDSDTCDFRDLLENAYIKIVVEEGAE